MKNVYLLLLVYFLIYASTASGKDEKSKLFLKIWDDSEFTVIFDNDTYNTPSTKFKLSKIEPGKHRLKVIKEITGPMGYSEKEVLYKGFITIPTSSKVVAKINQHNELVMINVQPLSKEDDVSGVVNEKKTNLLPSSDYKKLKEDMTEAKYESDKLQMTKNLIGKYNIKTSQVVEVIDMFGFESTKLEFAMYCYPYIVNKKSFYKVNDSFINSSSIKELEEFIKDYHLKNKEKTMEDDSIDDDEVEGAEDPE